MTILESAKSGKSRKGKTDYLNYLKGKIITQRQVIRAKCYDCDGMGETGECSIETCALLPFSPYNITGKHFPKKKTSMVGKRKINATDPIFKGQEQQETQIKGGI